MATSTVSLLKTPGAEAQQKPFEGAHPAPRSKAMALVSVLTMLSFLIQGYHPYAEDGGLYLAGVKRVLSPAMYPHETGFVLGHLRFSLFAPVVALFVRLSDLRLETALLLIYLAATWATLWSAWLLAEQCFDGRARVGSVALLATWLTLPVAGTSLMLMDPYVTARSVSTPGTLFAIYYSLRFLTKLHEEGEHDTSLFIKAGLSLVIASVMHPLMAAYGFGSILALAAGSLCRRRSWLASTGALTVGAVIVALILRLMEQPEPLDYHQVAMSRYYWFLSQWHWYEWMGIAGPLVILGFTAFAEKNSDHAFGRVALARMSITAGVASVLVSLLFARSDSASLIVARLQPLRVFQVIYTVMILFVGARLSSWLGRKKLPWATAFGILAAVMFVAERQTFPSSPHIELPSEHQGNAWVQAFEWIRANTPRDAFFALDSDYITKPGEDAQSFRAIAERSALPDYSKDGGEAAITPSLTAEWRMGQALQSGLSHRSDADRISALARVGVDWVVLTRDATTALPCAYANDAVKVCHLPLSPVRNGVGQSTVLEAKR
ncbi:MAG TPA: hypothetical protein VFS41_01935 [Edaphobacter sp.]|nr:hypothetical protein [Edaphobacter sp.]